jgi:hypothetical protein
VQRFGHDLDGPLVVILVTGNNAGLQGHDEQISMFAICSLIGCGRFRGAGKTAQKAPRGGILPWIQRSKFPCCETNLLWVPISVGMGIPLAVGSSNQARPWLAAISSQLRLYLRCTEARLIDQRNGA